MRRIITTFPFTTYGVVVLIAFICWMFVSAGTSYDDGGFGLWMFLLGMVLNVFGFPFFMTREFFFAMNNGQSFVGIDVLTVCIGLLICAGGDLLLWRYRSWKGRNLT